jgi:hypothetical protein
MKLVFDTDAFCKLAMAELLEDAARLLTASLSECCRLPALPHMLRKGRLAKRLGPDACAAMMPIAEAMPPLPACANPWLDKLTLVEAIDPGEAQIFALAAAETSLFVVSGDKRALRSLKAVEGIAEALSRRIVVLEAVLLGLCDRLGPNKLRQRVAPLMAADKMVQICFSAASAEPGDALLSYYRNLVEELRPLVLWDPRAGGPT